MDVSISAREIPLSGGSRGSLKLFGWVVLTAV